MGGAIAISGSMLNLSASFIADNSALLDGGAIYGTGSRGHPVFYVRGMMLVNNTAKIYGGGLFIEGSLGKQSSVEAILANGNTAGYGGGVASRYANVRIHNVLFFAHKALQSGGAVYASLGKLYVSSCHFIRVNARISGGMIFIDGADTLIKDTLMLSGRAEYGEVCTALLLHQ